MGTITAQSCVSEDGRGNGNMWRLYFSRSPLDVPLWHTGKNWKGWVEVLKYLGQLISYDDAKTQAVWLNLRKAPGCSARISQRVLRAENASPRMCGMFHKGTYQGVLLYWSETRCLSLTGVK